LTYILISYDLCFAVLVLGVIFVLFNDKVSKDVFDWFGLRLVYVLHKELEKVSTLSVVLLQKHFFFIKVCLSRNENAWARN